MNTSLVVSFRQSDLLLVNHEGQPFVPMKPVVDGMGLAWQTQHRKLMTGRFKQAITIMVIPSSGGEQETGCLPLRKLPGWLMSIHPNKVKPELRENIIAYQNECDDALWSYWNEGQAINPRSKPKKPKALPNGLTTEQQEAIKGLVKARVDSLPQDKRAKAAVKCWSALKNTFGCTYKKIDPNQFTDEVSLVARLELEGEFLGKEPEPKPADTLLPEAQAKEINERLTRLIFLFHLFSSPFADAHGIQRALRGLHPNLGMDEPSFRQVLKRP